MTIYISPFWCGVIATVLFEIAASIVIYKVTSKKK